MARENRKNETHKRRRNGNTPPHFVQPLPDQNGHPGRTVSFTASAQDDDGDSVKYALISTPPPNASIDANTGRFTWVPTAEQMRTWTITVQATDTASLSAVAQCQIFVMNQLPVIPPISQVFAQTGTKVSFNLNAFDPDGDLPLSYSAVSGPGTIDQAGQYTADPVPLGNNPVVVRVVDSLGGMSQANFMLTGE
jgi:hypothetical protein